MLKRILALTKIYYKLNFSAYQSKLGGKGVGNSILYGFLLIYLGGFAAFVSYYLVDTLLMIHQASYFIGLVLMLNIFTTLMEMVLGSINILYFSKDNEAVLPLPFKPFEIVAAKINSLLMMSYVTEIFFGLIPFAVYGFLVDVSIWFYPMALMVLILIPIVPTVFASLIVMIIMSFSKITKNKSLFQILTMFIGLVFAMSISFISSRSANYTVEELESLLSKSNEFVNIFRNLFPTLGFALDALTSNGFIDAFIGLLLLALSSIVVYIIFALSSQKLYFKGVIGCLYSSSSSSRKTIDRKKAFKDGKVYKSYILKEFRILIRKPIYLMQCVIPSLILPILMAAIFFFSFSSSMPEGQNLQELIKFAAFKEYSSIVFAIIIGYLFFCSMYVYISITAISRDGQGAYFMKYVPIPFYKQVLYKALIDSFFIMVVTIIIALMALFIGLPLHYIALAVCVMIPFSLTHGLIMILIDLKNPKIHWANEYQVVKSNFTIFYVLLYGLVNLMTLFLLFVFEMHYMVYAIILILIYSLITGLLLTYIKKKDFDLSRKIV